MALDEPRTLTKWLPSRVMHLVVLGHVTWSIRTPWCFMHLLHCPSQFWRLTQIWQNSCTTVAMLRPNRIHQATALLSSHVHFLDISFSSIYSASVEISRSPSHLTPAWCLKAGLPEAEGSSGNCRETQLGRQNGMSRASSKSFTVQFKLF